MRPYNYMFYWVTSWHYGRKLSGKMRIDLDLVIGVSSPGGFFIFLWQQTNTDLSSWQRSALLEYFIIPALSLGITDGLPDITINYTPLSLLSSALLYKQNLYHHCLPPLFQARKLSLWAGINQLKLSHDSLPNCLYSLHSSSIICYPNWWSIIPPEVWKLNSFPLSLIIEAYQVKRP